MKYQYYNNLLQNLPFDAATIIKSHLENIQTRFGVCINFVDIAGITGIHPQLELLFNDYSYHNNCFCNYVKKNNDCFEKCVQQKNKVQSACELKTSPFYGKCFMGIEEFIYPIRCEEKLIAFFCIGLFSQNIEESKREVIRQASLFGLNEQQCEQNYLSVIKSSDISIRQLSYDIELLCKYLSQLYMNYIYKYKDVCIEQAENLATNLAQNNFIINNTVYFINRNYHQDLSLKLLALNSFCNASYLSHIFKEKTGIGITDYINQIRIQNAQHLLDTTSLSITEVSNRVGYNDSAYFTRVFKRLTKLTPTNYRNRKT